MNTAIWMVPESVSVEAVKAAAQEVILRMKAAEEGGPPLEVRFVRRLDAEGVESVAGIVWREP